MPEPEPVRVGLVGAGPWATFVDAPLFAAHPDTTLVGVWARRTEAAAELAGAHDAVAAASIEDLIERCDVLAFAVPPAVQADLAVPAARAGRTLLLEKPLAADLAGAERLAAAVEAGGARTLVDLNWRFRTGVRAFLAEVAAGPEPTSARGWFRSGAALGGPFATPWRVDGGDLLDVGPHVLDLLDAALGSIVEVDARRADDGAVVVDLCHDGGAVSVAELSIRTTERTGSGIEVDGPAGPRTLDVDATFDGDTLPNLAAALVAVARGATSPLSIERALHLQRVLDRAAARLAET
jgi:predicted dehydrogenase